MLRICFILWFVPPYGGGLEIEMFRLIDNNGLMYYKIDSFEETGLVKHCFTTRYGGVSRNEYAQLNLRFHCSDDRENVLKNFEIICDEIGVDYKKLVLSKQVHEDIIYDVTAEDTGNGITKPNKLESADGLICAEPGIPLVTFYADCVPLLFLDKKERVIAMSHSGWKGTVKNIAAKTIYKMINDYNSKKENILCAIGPSICVDCFEVGGEVAEIFADMKCGEVVKYRDKYHVDLQKTIKNQLLECGVENDSITDSGICTFENSELLFSHRKTNGKRGNMAAVMQLI